MKKKGLLDPITLILVLIGIIILIFAFKSCDSIKVEYTKTEQSNTLDQECIYNHDCYINTEKCVDNKCIPWNLLNK